MKKIVIRNHDIKEILIGTPKSHKHIRAALHLKDGRIFVLHHATIANLVRAYTTITTHPHKKSIKLKGQLLENQKEGFAPYQLIETDEDEGLEEDLLELIEEDQEK
jgi:hypothetical protein